MSSPTIPTIDPQINIDREDAINLLLTSIALEEISLAHIINAEGEKIQSILGTLPGQTVNNPTLDELMAINKSVKSTLQTLIKKEMLLQFKLEAVLQIPRPVPPED
ncbi:hypothetical protein [Heliorestis convoluta]|uniref:hypothetical protein n=1 Tax=Heliorestis convoluta TaxID=356322 RepID=UPI00129AFD0F|nr:hypothetical protein [Heliorestis convoluta]